MGLTNSKSGEYFGGFSPITFRVKIAGKKTANRDIADEAVKSILLKDEYLSGSSIYEHKLPRKVVPGQSGKLAANKNSADFIFGSGKERMGPYNWTDEYRCAPVHYFLNFARKDYLYDVSMDQKYKDIYMMAQKTIDSYNFVEKTISCTGILKPVLGKKGSGIKIVKSCEEIKQHLKRNKADRYWVIAKYLKNPLLSEGKKFHLRMMFLIYKFEGFVYGFVLKNGFMFRSVHNYSMQSAVHNAHNVHQASGATVLPFPDKGDEKLEGLFGQLKDLFSHIFHHDVNKFTSYDNILFPYAILGADIMITEENKIKLLEINSNPGFDFLDETLAKGFVKSLHDAMLARLGGKSVPEKDTSTYIYLGKYRYTGKKPDKTRIKYNNILSQWTYKKQ